MEYVKKMREIVLKCKISRTADSTKRIIRIAFFIYDNHLNIQ